MNENGGQGASFKNQKEFEHVSQAFNNRLSQKVASNHLKITKSLSNLSQSQFSPQNPYQDVEGKPEEKNISKITIVNTTTAPLLKAPSQQPLKKNRQFNVNYQKKRQATQMQYQTYLSTPALQKVSQRLQQNKQAQQQVQKLIPKFQNFPNNTSSQQQTQNNQNINNTAREPQSEVIKIQNEISRGESCENIPVESRQSKLAQRKQQQSSQINFKSMASQNTPSHTMTPIQGIKIHQALNPNKTIWQPHKKKTFHEKSSKIQNKKNTQKIIQDRGISSLEICDEMSHDGNQQWAHQDTSEVLDTHYSQIPRKVPKYTQNQPTQRMVTLIKDMNYVDEQYMKIFKVLPKDLISRNDLKPDINQKAQSRNDTLINSEISSAQSSKRKIQSNQFNSQQNSGDKNLEIQNHLPTERQENIYMDVGKHQQNLFTTAKMQMMSQIGNAPQKSGIFSSKVDNQRNIPNLSEIIKNNFTKSSEKVKESNEGINSFVSPFSTQIPSANLEAFHKKMMKQSNDQTPIKNRGIGHPYGKNEENFSEEEEHSFGLAMDNMLPQGQKQALNATSQIFANSLAENAGDNDIQEISIDETENQTQRSIPIIQNSFKKIGIKESIETNSVRGSSRSRDSRGASNSQQTRRRGHTDIKQRSRSSRPSNNSQRFRGPSQQSCEKITNQQNITVSLKVRNLASRTSNKSPSIGDDFDEDQETTVKITKSKNQKNQVQKLRINEINKNTKRIQNDSSRKSLQVNMKSVQVYQQKSGAVTQRGNPISIPIISPKENKLSLRLSNLKNLSPSRFIKNQDLSHIDLRNNRIHELPDEICTLQALLEVKLDYNFLQTLPQDMNKLKNLQLLSVSQNNLKAIPHNVLLLSESLEVLILNDNKISSIPSKLGCLFSLKTLFLHNNLIVDVPSTLYKLKKLTSFSLDWFAYLYSDQMQIQSKVLKGVLPDNKKGDLQSYTKENEEKEEARRQQLLIDKFLKMCLFSQIAELKSFLEKRQRVLHQNPQQDDSEQVARDSEIGNFGSLSRRDIPFMSMPKGVSKKRKGLSKSEKQDPLSNQKSVKISFLKFLMFFQCQPQVDQLILKSLFPSKQRKLSHLIAIQGHQYLLSDTIKQIDNYHFNALTFINSQTSFVQLQSPHSLKLMQTKHHFLNSVDQDFTTPLILALKNKRMVIVKDLLEQQRICLRQSSMKYGTALHVALSHEDLKIAGKILKMLKEVPDFQASQDLNKVDEDGNTPLHVIMRNFTNDSHTSSKLCLKLIKNGGKINLKNKNHLTPLHQALYYTQNSAIQFALGHNKKLKKRSQVSAVELFDFTEKGGKLNFTPLHYAVYQNNFPLLFMLLTSDENIDHQSLDAQGRRAIDLCNSISAIFKALRREIKKQSQKILVSNLLTVNQKQVNFEGIQKKLIANMNLSHFYLSTRVKKSNQQKELIQVRHRKSPPLASTFGQRHMSHQFNFSESNFTLPDNVMQIQTENSVSILSPKETPRALPELPGAFNRKISLQSSINKPSLMTTGLSFNRAKNQFAQHKFTVQKASISILNSNTPKTQNIVPSLPLNKLNKFQNDHPQNQEQNSQSLQSSFMNFNNDNSETMQGLKTERVQVQRNEDLGVNVIKKSQEIAMKQRRQKYFERKRSVDNTGSFQEFQNLRARQTQDQENIKFNLKSVNEIQAEVDSFKNLKAPLQRLGQNEMIEQKFLRLSPNEQFQPLATQRLTFNGIRLHHNASVQIPKRKLPSSPGNYMPGTQPDLLRNDLNLSESQNSFQRQPRQRLNRPFAQNQKPVLHSHSQQSLNLNDLNSDNFGQDSESSSWKDSVSLERFKNKIDGDVHDVSESDDENVSEDEEIYGSRGSQRQSPFQQDQILQNKETETLDEFQDVETLMKHIFKIHNQGRSPDKLELLERINDSLQGKLVDQLIQQQNQTDVKKGHQRRQSVKPSLLWNKEDPYQDMPELKPTEEEDVAPQFSDLESNELNHSLKKAQMFKSNPKEFSDFKEISDDEQERCIEPIQSSKSNAPIDFQHHSFSVTQKIREEEQDLDLTKVHGVNAQNESQLLYNLDHVDQNSDEEREIKLPVIKMKENFSSFNKNMSGSVFGQKRQSYLNYDQNQHHSISVSNRVRMKSQASDNDIIETITTIKSDFSDESPAKKYNKAPVAFQKQLQLDSQHQIEEQKAIIKLTEVISLPQEKHQRMEIQKLLDEVNLEHFKQKGRGQILKYVSKIQTVQTKAKKIGGLFYQNIVYELDNLQQILNRKLPQQVPPTSDQLFQMFPQKLGQDRFNSTFRQTMMNRPTLLQTNKPDQSLNISLQGSLNESGKKPIDSSTKVLKINNEFSPYLDKTPTLPGKQNGVKTLSQIDFSKQQAYQNAMKTVQFQPHDSKSLRSAKMVKK